MKNYIELLTKLIKKINFLFLPIFLLLLIFIFLINYSSALIGAKYADNISIEITGLIEEELKNIKVYRVSLNNNTPELRVINNKWSEYKKYFKNIYIKMPLTLKDKFESLILTIGDKKYIFNREKFDNEFKIINIEENLYQIPEYFLNSKSFISKFDKIVNYPGDFIIIKKEFIKSLIIVFLIPLIILFIFIFLNFINYIFSNLNLKNEKNGGFSQIILFIFSILIVILFFNAPGISDVPNSWLKGWWMNNFIKYGFIKGYQETGDNYPPLGFIFIGLTNIFSNLTKIDIFYVYKFFLLFFQIISSIVIILWTKDYIIATLFNLFSVIGTMGHGYFDIFYTPFLIGSLFALYKNRLFLFTILFSICCLIKYQPLIFAPFILLYLLNINNFREINKIDYKKLSFKVFIPTLIIIFTFFIIFGPHFFASLIKGTQHSSLSFSALNLNWIITYFLHIFDPVNYGQLNIFNYEIESVNNIIPSISKILFILFYFLPLWIFFIKKEKVLKDLILYSILGYLSYFIFNTGVHQNHLYPVIVLSSLLIYFDKKYYVDHIFMGLIFNINLLLFYGLNGNGIGFNRAPFNFDISILFAFIFIIFYIIFFKNNIIDNKDNYNFKI